ncbi:MAG: thioredoxin family protein, partial [bacterium]
MPKDIYSEFWYNMVALKMVAEKEMKTTTEESFESVVGQASELVIADFYSQSCKPCLLMHSDLEELEREYDGRMKLVRVDIAESVDLASRYSVVSTPTIIMFAGGKPVTRILGYLTRRDLKEKIEEQLKQIA